MERLNSFGVSEESVSKESVSEKTQTAATHEQGSMAEKTFEELQIKDDFMFCLVMREPKYCKPFLERVLGVRISRIEYPNPQKTIDLSADAKGVRLDIYVEDGRDTVYNIEMQAERNSNLPKRTRYYQGMVDLNILEKGNDYKQLKQSFIIFVCTFDLFGEERHIYTFENRCVQNLGLRLGDGTTKIILNTKGTMNDVTPELKNLLDYIDGKEPEDDYTRELDEAVQSARKNEKWRLDYMTLQMHYQEKYEQGRREERRNAVKRMLQNNFKKEQILLLGYTESEYEEAERELFTNV